MADSYIRAFGTLLRGTYIAAIPGDLRRIIREMYPRSYTFDTMLAFTRQMYSVAFGTGSEQAVSEWALTMWDPQFREFLLHYESSRRDKLEWWRDHYGYISNSYNPAVLDDVRSLCLQMYGAEFWDKIINNDDIPIEWHDQDTE